MKYPFLLKLALFICLGFTTVFAQAQPNQNLSRYTCLTDLLDVDQFLTGRKTDSLGVVVTEKGYHPLAVTQYGILSYDAFLATGDSSYYWQVLNQAEFFRDTSHLMEKFEGRGVALPYRFNFWDLRAPWYSGMTQGSAVSFLLRYQQLTKDTSFADLIPKLLYPLKIPVSKGGCLAQNPLGCSWLEEYPNSSQAPHVMNGYINALIGLKEYLDFYPEDSEAVSLFENTYSCLKESLHLYEVNGATLYNLGTRYRPCKPEYVRYQVLEMQHLFELFGEELFLNQARLWSSLTYQKPILTKGGAYVRRNHNQTVPFQKTADASWAIQHQLHPNYKRNAPDTDRFSSWKHYRQNKPSTGSKPSRKWIYLFEFSSSVKLDYLVLNHNEEHYKNFDLTLHYYPNQSSIPREIQGVLSTRDSNQVHFQCSDSINTQKILVELEFGDKMPPPEIRLLTYQIPDHARPFYSQYISARHALQKGQSYQLTINRNFKGNYRVYYRRVNSKQPNHAQWFAKNALAPGEKFKAPESGQYEFKVLLDYQSLNDRIFGFSISAAP